jgi:hypothetical protein
MIKMNRELKDGLKDVIIVGLQDFKSIGEILRADYEKYKTKGEGYNTVIYRNKILLLDIEDSGQDISAFDFVKQQIEEINKIEDGE